LARTPVIRFAPLFPVLYPDNPTSFHAAYISTSRYPTNATQ